MINWINLIGPAVKRLIIKISSRGKNADSKDFSDTDLIHYVN